MSVGQVVNLRPIFNRPARGGLINPQVENLPYMAENYNGWKANSSRANDRNRYGRAAR
jgi:hypothetical protein